MMKRYCFFYLLLLCMLMTGTQLWAQQRRPIDSQHPMWMIHVDVWNVADPQKIIDLIPEEIKPYVCMNLSLSCQYDKDRNIYKMPRCAVRTYKSWASVCQANGLFFTCQPASGGHTHIQDDDLETFEYFFKRYPNFLGWNYAEQFWGFDESGDKSSSTQASRLALFAKLVPMHHQYGGVLTISFCGNIWSHGLNPIGMMKRNKTLLQACKDYPEAILWLYKYTTSSCFYNNETVTFGPFFSGIAKNYGVRYDNCGWNGALSSILGDGHGKSYPGAAGIGTVMEQTCVNGGAVWDGPELIWTEDFQNLSNSSVSGYSRRNWGTFPNMKGIWLDMFKKIIDGTMYIPTREEVVGKTKIAIINDKSSGSDEDKYATWGNLYDGVYKQTDPFNRNNGQWMDNFLYLKSTGRYGTIPMVIALYDSIAKAVPVQVKKSGYTSRWGSITKKTNDFNAQYPEVSTGDLYVNRYRNQLVTYTPYSYLNSKKTASASIPLLYNTCDSLLLNYGKLSSGLIREYADHIYLYLNNYRNDSTTQQTDKITIKGVTAEPTYNVVKRTIGIANNATITKSYDETNHTFTLNVKHLGPLDVTINCTGTGESKLTDVLPADTLPIPQQPAPYVGPITIEAEDMDFKSIKGCNTTNSGYYYPEVLDFAGNGFVDMGTSKSGSLRHQLNLQEAGDYDIFIRYCNLSAANTIAVTINGVKHTANLEQHDLNDWHKVKVTGAMKAGTNTLIITNSGGKSFYIDQIIYSPAGTPAEKFLVTIRDAEHGTLIPNVSEAAEGDTVRLTVNAEEGYQIKELRVINSVYFTMAKTIEITDPNNITFVMPDDNVTLQASFYDASALYKLDFTDVLGGTLPPGWRCVQENSSVHQYPNSYDSGARVFSGFTGHQGKALYWREGSAEYGRQTAYPLNLNPGDYKLTFAMAAWKESPKYKVSIIEQATGNSIATSQVYTATPNANGNSGANVTSAVNRELPFTVTNAGKYIISFTNESNTSAYDEYLLLECRVNAEITEGITIVTPAASLPAGIYSPSGVRLEQLQRGMNIVVSADGTIRKVMKK